MSSPHSVDTVHRYSTKPTVAIGSERTGFGSWNWIGADTAKALSNEFDVRIFQQEVPATDVVIFVKARPEFEMLRGISEQSVVIYCPVDVYGSAADIDQDAPALSCCSRIIVHCERLRRYFSTYAQVEYVDHHLRYVAPLRSEYRQQGPLLWVGVEGNLPPLVAWANRQSLAEELVVLTNASVTLDPNAYGFQPHNRIRIERWTEERQLQLTEECRCALDVKGDDFRSRHKPPAKAIDFLASGIPLALQPESSPAMHLAKEGFRVAALDDPARWNSREYWDEVVQFAAELRGRLTLERVAKRWSNIIWNVLAERHRPNS